MGTTLVPVTQSGTYKTPTIVTSLEFVSDDVNDTILGSGARVITLIGLGSDWKEVTQNVVTNGTTPVILSINLLRLYRWYVAMTGTYATDTVHSHAGNLTIQEAGGGTVWSNINIAPVPVGQSQIGCYTIPIGKTGYLFNRLVYTESNKTTDVYLFSRDQANVTFGNITGTKRIVEKLISVAGGFTIAPTLPDGPFVGPCDLMYMAKVSSGTGEVSIDFELLLVDI